HSLVCTQEPVVLQSLGVTAGDFQRLSCDLLELVKQIRCDSGESGRNLELVHEYPPGTMYPPPGSWLLASADFTPFASKEGSFNSARGPALTRYRLLGPAITH